MHMQSMITDTRAPVDDTALVDLDPIQQEMIRAALRRENVVLTLLDTSPDSRSSTSMSLGFSPESLDLVARDSGYILTFRSGSTQVRLDLSPTLLHCLGMQCQDRLREIALDQPVGPMQAITRESVHFVKAMSDRSLQLFLRECESETLISFLWYMKDAEMTGRLCSNMSSRVVAALMVDLAEHGGGCSPDHAEAHLLRQGREAVLDVLGIVRRMVREGRIKAAEIPQWPGCGDVSSVS